MKAGLSLAIFAFAWVLIAVRRLPVLPIGRTFGALLGATLLVLVAGFAPDAACHAVDGNTLALLFGMMVLQVELDASGLLDAATVAIARRGWSATRLLCVVLCGAGVLSALLVNDAVCLMATPLVARLCRKGGLPPLPFLLAVAIGSNVGGTMTAVGTPQCVLIERFSGLGYAGFSRVMAPVGLGLLAVSSAFCAFVFRRSLAGRRVAPVEAGTPVDAVRARAFLVSIGAVVVGFLAGLPLAWTALAGACLDVVLRRADARDTLARVDLPLLVFFAALFVLVGGIVEAGWVDRAVGGLTSWLGHDPSRAPWRFAAFSVGASNVFSNVPFVLVLGHGYPGASSAFWYQLALSSTLAGNLTLVGSVANLIVAEQAHREGVEIGFLDYFKVGVPLTLLTTAAGIGLLAFFGAA